MSARTNLVLKDRAGTPVSHTFTPDGDTPEGVHVFSEKTSVPAGNPQYTAFATRKGGKYRPSLRLTIPIVQTQTINGVSTPVVVRTAQVWLSAVFDELSSEQERKDAIGQMADSLDASQTQINDLLLGTSDIY